MKIKIEILGNPKAEQILHLKKFLENQNIDELENIEVATSKAKPGQMGDAVVANTLTAVVGGNEGPFAKLASALVKYIEILKSEISLKNDKGEELVISAKLKKEEVLDLVNKFYDKSRKKK